MVTTIKPQRAVIRSLMAVLMAALAIGLVSPSAKADTALPAGTAIAVAGANSQVYVRGPGQLGFTNWGGLVVGSPAVVMVQNITHVLALGTNNYVYHKSDRTGWHRLTTLPYYCTHISATFDGTTIVGACRGGQGALYTFDFDALEDVPVVTEMTKLGGLFQGTPAVIVTDAGPTFFVVGGAYVSNNWIYNVHEWTEDEGGCRTTRIARAPRRQARRCTTTSSPVNVSPVRCSSSRGSPVGKTVSGTSTPSPVRPSAPSAWRRPAPG